MWNTKFAGKQVAIATSAWGYRYIKVFAYKVHLHHLVWALKHGRWPDGIIDHINGDKADNRVSNLRQVDAQSSARNKPMYRNNTTGHVGVVKYRSRYVAKIGVGGKYIHIGVFDTLAEAVATRKAAEAEYGFHANHGRNPMNGDEGDCRGKGCSDADNPGKGKK
jgi:hypothetical protein